MASQGEGPWYRASKGGWYLKVNRKQVSLRVKGRKNRKAAIEAWHRLTANPTPQQVKEAPQKPKDGPKVKGVVDGYLADAKGRLKANTYQSNRWILDTFSEAMGKAKAEALTVANVIAYASRPEWSQAYRRNVLGSIKTVFRWAEENAIIGTNPIKTMKRPGMTSRGAKANITPDPSTALGSRQGLLPALPDHVA